MTLQGVIDLEFVYKLVDMDNRWSVSMGFAAVGQSYNARFFINLVIRYKIVGRGGFTVHGFFFLSTSLRHDNQGGYVISITALVMNA